MAKSRNRQSRNNEVKHDAIQTEVMQMIDVKTKLAEYQKKISGIVTQDAFQNEMARIGFGQPNLLETTTYPLTRMSYNFNLFNSMYRNSWIVRKIIDIVPSDMMKNWIKIVTQVEPDALKKFDKVIRQTGTKAKITEGMRWGRLYGGAAALIVIDGDQEKLDEPLDYDAIMPDSYKGLMIFDRWSGVVPSSEKIEDLDNPEFGLPEYYTITTQTAEVYRVHHTRMLRFTGRPLPYWEKMAEIQWGESEIEVVFEELKKRDNTSYNIAYLTFLANVRVLKMSDLGEVLSTTNAKAKESLYNVLEAQNWLMSNMGMYIMDKDDDFDTKQYSFSGLSEIYETFMLDVAGACEMPVTKLFGRNPAGFNATGESDLKQYFETIESKQQEYLAPILDKLLPVIAMSAWGAIPDDFEWDFNPVMVVDNKELADLSGSYTTQVLEAFNAGLVKKSTALKELRQQSEITGMWTNITDKDIEEADEEGDMPPGEGEAMQGEIQAGMQAKQQAQGNPQLEQKNAPQSNLNAQKGTPEQQQMQEQPQQDTWREKIAAKFGTSGGASR